MHWVSNLMTIHYSGICLSSEKEMRFVFSVFSVVITLIHASFFFGISIILYNQQNSHLGRVINV